MLDFSGIPSVTHIDINTMKKITQKRYDKTKTGLPKVKGTVKQNYMGKKMRQYNKSLRVK